MKLHILTTLILLSIFSSIGAQTFQQVFYPDLPFDTINYEHEYSIESIIPLEDEGALVLGNDDNFGYLSKINPTGNSEWSKRLSLPLDTNNDTVQVFVMQGLELDDGSFLISARTGGSFINPSNLALFKLDNTGGVLWARRYPGFRMYVSAMQLEGGSILLIGNENLGGQNAVDIMRLDSDGNFQDGRRCIFPFWFTSLKMDGVVYQDEKFLFWDSFFEGVGGPNQNDFSTMVSQYDINTGAFIHNYQAESLTSSVFAQRIIYDITLDTDGSRFFSYQHEGNFLLTKYFADGGEAWTYDIGTPGHLLLEGDQLLLLGSTDDPNIAAFLTFDKETGNWDRGYAYPSFANTFFLGAPQHTGNGAFYWPVLANDPIFTPLPIEPVGLVHTGINGFINTCEPIEVCAIDQETATPSAFPPFNDLDEEDMEAINISPLMLIVEDINFINTPFCIPGSNEIEPDASFTIQSPACTGDSILVFPTAADTDFTTSEWTSPMAQPGFSDMDTAYFQFFDTGTFEIEHIINQEGCKDTVVNTIEILPGPVFNLGADTSLCIGDSLLLESGITLSGTTYLWQDGSMNASFLATGAGTFSLEATNQFGCIYTDEITIISVLNPQFSLGPDTTICKGATYTFAPISTPSDVSYFWNNGAQSNSLTANEEGWYTLTLLDTINACRASDSVRLIVRPFPVFTYQPVDTVYCPGVELILRADNLGNEILDFTWPDGLIGDEYILPDAGSFPLVASDGPCTDTLWIDVPAGDCPANIYIPTAFTPNDDGRNDLFEIYGSDIETLTLRVFNRWGGLIYEGMGSNAYWDGNFNSESAAAGVYIYWLEYQNKLSLQLEQKKGEILLIR